MGAWKLRAIVYGLLLAVAALAMVQRGWFRGHPAPPEVLYGRTSQGSPVRMTMTGVRIANFTIDSIRGQCRHGPFWIRWYPSTSQGNVTYRRRGIAFVVNERPDSRFPHPPGMTVTSTMTGHVAITGDSVSGVVSWVGRLPADTCRSGPVPFAVARTNP